MVSSLIRVRDQGSPSANKKERRTKPIPATPAKGRVEQHLADAPGRGRGYQVTASTLVSPKTRLAVFAGSNPLTLARHFKLSIGSHIAPGTLFSSPKNVF